MKNALQKIVAMGLWLISALLAGYEVFLVRHIVRHTYLWLHEIFVFSPRTVERLTASAIGNLAAVLMAFVAIAIVIGGFDYHWSYAGQRKSYKLLAFTFILELAILGTYITMK